MNLFSNTLLETALAIIIAWSLFSLLCSYLHEAIAQTKAERGRFLKHYLLKQFQDKPNGVNWASLLYLHGSVDLLSRAFNKPSSEISPSLFAKTLIEVVGKSHLVQMQINQNPTANANQYHDLTLRNFKKAIDCLNPSDIINLFEQCLQDADIKSRTGDQADESLVYSRLVENIEDWYTVFIDRVSYWYKKRTKKRLFILGAIIACMINVDSIELFRHFNTDSTARKALIAYYAENKAKLEEQADELKAQQSIITPDLKQIDLKIASLNHSLDSLSKTAELPIGFGNSFYSFLKTTFGKPTVNVVVKPYNTPIIIKEKLNTTPADTSVWFKLKLSFLKLLGFLITGFAVSFGAPFWFDLLKKIYTIKR